MLHYPAHLWFLYHAMKHTNLAVSILVGAFMSGLACAMVRQTHEGRPLSLRTVLVNGEVPYGRVMLLWLMTWGLAKGMLELASRFAPKTTWVFWIFIGLAVILQALLVYAIPAAVFEDAKWWKAAFRGVLETCRHPLSTLLVVTVPSAMVISFAILASPVRAAQWMMHLAPEIAIPLVTGRLVVWTVADTLLTISVAHLWWIHRAAQHSVAHVKAALAPTVSPGMVLEEGHVVA